MTAATVPTVTGWQGLYSNAIFLQSNGGGVGFSFPTAAQNGARNPQDKLLARILKRNGYRNIAGLMNGLIGAATGSNVTVTHKQVDAPSGPQAATPVATGIADFGGNRTIATITDMNRNTAASDVTWLKKYFNNLLLEAGLTYGTYAGTVGGGINGQAGQVNGVNRF